MATDYGTDISCVDDIARDGRVVSGVMVVGEAICRRLLTPRGRLIGDPDYGFDLTAYINDDILPRDLAGVRAGIVAECLKDERVTAASVDTVLAVDGKMIVTIDLTLSTETFTLVLGVSAVTIEILKVTQ